MLRIKRILVPVDFSDYTSSAVKHGHELADLHNAELELVHILMEPKFPAFYKMGEEALYGESTSIEQRCRDALRALIEEAKGEHPEAGIGLHIERGDPADEIIDFANEHDVDLIVISSHGLSGVERVLMGSVATEVVKNAPCPVLVLKAFGKSLLQEG